MADFEVYLDWGGDLRRVGLARGNRVRGGETVVFDYDDAWLQAPDAFPLELGLPLTRGTFAPAAGLPIFGSLGDSAPDTWGKRLMRRAERRRAD